jgi:hypothetical protein
VATNVVSFKGWSKLLLAEPLPVGEGLHDTRQEFNVTNPIQDAEAVPGSRWRLYLDILLIRKHSPVGHSHYGGFRHEVRTLTRSH